MAGADPANGAATLTASSCSPDEPQRLGDDEVRFIIVGVVIAMFLAALNQTVIATALPTIGRALGNVALLAWVVTAYLLAATVVAPLYGKLADVHGRRVVMMAAIAVFVAGSTIAAAAPDMITLVIGRGIQGIGGGGIFPLAQTIISDVVPGRERGRYQAFIGIVWLASGLGGPVIGGWFAEHGHWSMIFWMNLPLGGGAAVLTWRALARLPRHEHPHRIDFLGAGLMTVAAVALLLVLDRNGGRLDWLSWPVAGLLALSILFTLLFSLRLVRAKEPFLPPAVLKNPVVRLGTLASATAIATPTALTIFLPLYFESVHGLSAAGAGVALIPFAIMNAPGSILSSRIMMVHSRYKMVPMIGYGVGIAAAAVLIAAPAASLGLVITLLCVIGFACGTAIPVCTVSVQNAVVRHQVGTATGVMNFFRALASALLVAIMGAIVLAGFGDAPGRGRAATYALVSLAATDAAQVFRWVFVVAVVSLLVGLAALVWMEERPLAESAPERGG